MNEYHTGLSLQEEYCEHISKRFQLLPSTTNKQNLLERVPKADDRLAQSAKNFCTRYFTQQDLYRVLILTLFSNTRSPPMPLHQYLFNNQIVLHSKYFCTGWFATS